MFGNDDLIAIYLPNLYGGGAEKVTITLANEIALSGYRVDLLVGNLEGPLINDVSKKINLISFNSSRIYRTIPGYIYYLRKNRPRFLISAMNHSNIISLVAAIMSMTGVKVISCEHSTPSKFFGGLKKIKSLILVIGTVVLYPFSWRIVAVSEGVAKNLKKYLFFGNKKIKVIYNPVIGDVLYDKSAQAITHDWYLNKKTPIIISVGRMTDAKDYFTLLRAFGLVVKSIKARLIILGDGVLRDDLRRMIDDLGISEFVDMPGFVDNPYPYIKQSDLFVLSSKWEGLPSVLIEAAALNVSVVSTDCDNGPREILKNFPERLVPVGDEKEMARAMIYYLDKSGCENIDLNLYKTNVVVEQYIEMLNGTPN